MPIIYPAGVPEVPVSSQESAALLAQPFNSAKVGELSVAALTGVGLTDAWIFEITPANTLITFAVPQDTAQSVIDNAITALNAVCVDPTRNELTEDQIEDAALQSRIDAMTAGVDAINNPGGLNDQLLTNNAWNALTADAQADILRGLYRASGQALDYRKIIVELQKSVKYLLKQEQKRQDAE